MQRASYSALSLLFSGSRLLSPGLGRNTGSGALNSVWVRREWVERLNCSPGRRCLWTPPVAMAESREGVDIVAGPASGGEFSEEERYKDYRGQKILQFIGFEITQLTGTKSTGKFVVDKNSCQPFNVLHGGTTAYIAESIASVSGSIAAGLQRVAGIELSCSHLRSAPVGAEVHVTAVPLRLGNRVQVWEVKFETSKYGRSGANEVEPSESSTGAGELVICALARVTLLVGLPNTLKSNL